MRWNSALVTGHSLRGRLALCAADLRLLAALFLDLLQRSTNDRAVHFRGLTRADVAKGANQGMRRTDARSDVIQDASTCANTSPNGDVYTSYASKENVQGLLSQSY